MVFSVKLRFYQRRQQLIGGLGLLLLVTLIPHLKSSPTSYAYSFSSPSAVDITGQLEQEVSFHKNRIRHTPEDGLSQAALAGTYLKLARATGDATWYLLAEQTVTYEP